MRSLLAICLLLAAGCVTPQPIRVHPILVDATVQPVVCPAGQVAFYAVGYPNEPLVHSVTIVWVNGEQLHYVEECDH